VGGLDIPHEVDLGAPEPAHRQGAGEAAEPIYATGFSADGSSIFGRHVQGTLTLWNADTLELVRSFDIARGKGRWNATALSADGNSVVCTCDPTHDTIALISTETGEVIREFEGSHDGHITAVTMHPNGKLIASAAMDGTVKVWDTVSGGLINTIRDPRPKEKPIPVLAVAFSPDGTTLATAIQSIQLWYVKDLLARKTEVKASHNRNLKP
jgi:WD40 repeat protein